MRNLSFLLLTLIVLISCSSTQNKNREQNIDSIFKKMESQGVDTKKPLLYGFFFYDKDKSKLEKLKEELLKDNYKLVRLEMTEKQQFILHVEKIEIHSRTSLLEREGQLEKLAEKFQISTYDGWDVGNVDSKKPLVSNDSFEKSLENKTDAELYKIANELYWNETLDKAIIVFQKCIEHNYKIDTCNYEQGVSYISIGQKETGLKKLEEAIRINPKYFKAYFNIAATSYDNHEYEKTIEYYKKAAKLDSKNDKVYYGIAAAQYLLGSYKEAKNNCQIALNINPANDDAKNLLANMSH